MLGNHSEAKFSAPNIKDLGLGHTVPDLDGDDQDEKEHFADDKAKEAVDRSENDEKPRHRRQSVDLSSIFNESKKFRGTDKSKVIKKIIKELSEKNENTSESRTKPSLERARQKRVPNFKPNFKQKI